MPSWYISGFKAFNIVMEKAKVWNWLKSAGVAVVSAISMLGFLGAVFGQETNSTTTTTAINWTIDPAPLINLVVALLPAILVIIIIKAVLGSLSGFARLSKVHGWFKANWHKIAPVAVLCLLVAGAVTGVTPVAAQTSTPSLNFDISGLVNLVLALLPLIIILVIMKALIQAFQGIAR
ncbi:MAG: hypothetical protein QW707_07345 [Candidatus Bathyarchaeia archaeon]